MSAQEMFTWKGTETFLLTGSGLHEDTLRVAANRSEKSERLLQLVLPTLCITYADMAFQNAVGGEQANYPASADYGPAHFDPPVEIRGEAEIERLTYIRGARRVEIGPKATVIEFGDWKDLVIPRLRVDRKKPAVANLIVPETRIPVDEPLSIAVMQFADGRHVGGVRLEKRHPKWVPPKVEERYDLWIRVIDGLSRRPLQETMVNVWHWDPELRTPYGKGGFNLDAHGRTDGNGVLTFADRPTGQVEAYNVDLPGWRVVPRSLRPKPGQRVRLHMRAWPLDHWKITDEWKLGDSLDRDCFDATYRFESWDDPDRVGAAFGYKNAAGLAEANGLPDLSAYDPGVGLRLPDWKYFYARPEDTLDTFDEAFGLPRGSSITVGRVYRPQPRLLFAGETVAVPSALFAKRLAGA